MLGLLLTYVHHQYHSDVNRHPTPYRQALIYELNRYANYMLIKEYMLIERIASTY